jgi:hypothetical protein
VWRSPLPTNRGRRKSGSLFPTICLLEHDALWFSQALLPVSVLLQVLIAADVVALYHSMPGSGSVLRPLAASYLQRWNRPGGTHG